MTTTTIDRAVSNHPSSNFNVPDQDESLNSIVADHHQETENQSKESIGICHVLQKQNDALRQELHDIRREMEEINDQFRTEDAEEFKQLQAELEVSAKTCRILQFKLRKAEKRSEILEEEKTVLQEKLEKLSENRRVGQDFNDELLIAKEVSVRLHSELEKSEEARRIAEKFNETLKQQFSILKTSIDASNETQHDHSILRLSNDLYESLIRENFLIEQISVKSSKFNEQNFKDVVRSYQEKIDSLNEQILQIKENHNEKNLKEFDFSFLSEKIDQLVNAIRENRIESDEIRNLQDQLKNSRWTKNSTENNSLAEKISNINRNAVEFVELFHQNEILFEKLNERWKIFESNKNQSSTTIENLQNKLKQIEEQLQAQIFVNETLENSFEQEKLKVVALNEEKRNFINLTNKQNEELQHLERLRESIVVFEKKLDQKQTRVNELSMRIIEKEDFIENKVKECQKHRIELKDLEMKYFNLGKQLEEQITEMTKEINKLNVEKETLKFDLESLRLAQENDRSKSTVEEEIERVKNECRQQIVDGEIGSFKLRLNQSNNEKDELIKNLRELEKKFRDLQIKNNADQISFSRSKTEMIEKQKKYDEAIKMKSELQNAVERLRQKLYDVEIHSQEKQNRFNADKNHWEIQTLEWIAKINELEEQLSKVNKRQRKDLEISWKKERTELQKQLQQCQELINELQTQLIQREQPTHFNEKINILITENELLLNKIKELENLIDNIEILKNEVQLLKEKNSSDWNYWRKQQSDLYAQLRQQINLKESIFYKFERLEKQIKIIENEKTTCFVRDTSVGPISLNSFQNETNLSSFNKEIFVDEIDLPHGTIDGRPLSTGEIVGGIDESTVLSSMTNYGEQEKQRTFQRAHSAQENVASSIEKIAEKVDRVEENLFSYRRFMDFIRSKSEKSSSVVRDDSFTKIPTIGENSIKRLGSVPSERNTLNAAQRRSRFDANPTLSQDSFRSIDDYVTTNLMSNSMSGTLENEMGTSKNRFFSLGRRFRFRTESIEKSVTTPTATVHFLDQDIDLETKEPTTRKSEQRPSKGILKSLRHRSPFRFRSKDPVIVEQEAPPPVVEKPKQIQNETQTKTKNLPKKSEPTTTTTKSRGRLVELKKTTTKTSSTNSRQNGTNSSNGDSSTSTLFRRTSGLKDLIHKFEPTGTNDRTVKTKRVTIDDNRNEQTSIDLETNETNGSTEKTNEELQQRTMPLTFTNKSKTIDIPDLLRNVEKETSIGTRPILRHSNSTRQTTSFDSTTSMISATDSIGTTNSTTRKPTSTARPLMLSINKEES